MKNYIYILFFGIMLMVSCSKNDDDLSHFKMNEKVCTPYMNISFNSADLPLYAFDESTSIVGHRISDNCLVLDTRFSGGCEDHELVLLIDESGQSSINATSVLPALLSHDNTDQCEAIVALEVFVDISRLSLLNLSVVQLKIEGYNPIIEITL